MSSKAVAETEKRRFRQPAESDVHAGTLMSWPTKSSVYGGDINATRSEIASIARAIAKHEPLHLLVYNDTNYGSDLPSAQKLLGDIENVTIHATPNVDSLWTRDTGPILVYSDDGPVDNTYPGLAANPGYGFVGKNTSSQTVALGLHFSQWGRKLPPTPDSYAAGAAAEVLGISSYHAQFTGEGGSFEIDGCGTLIATESSLLNPNRNPGVSKEEMEAFFFDLFAITKTVWLPGAAGTDITDTHVDGLARFGGKPANILLSKPWNYDNGSADADAAFIYKSARAVLEQETDAQGRRLTIIDVEEPPFSVLGDDFESDLNYALTYVNFYLATDAVVLASFGDRDLDEQARRLLQEQFPDREIEQVRLRQLAIQGGGVHCATQQILPLDGPPAGQ